MNAGSPGGARGTAAGAVRHEDVPPGLAGERLDVAMSRIFGISRSTASDLVAARQVLVDGRPGVKSDRLAEGAHLSVRFTQVEEQPAAAAAVVPGLWILRLDDDIAVIDQPVGVAAHPSPAGRARPCSVTSPRAASRSRVRDRPNGPGSCTGSTRDLWRDGARAI